MGILKLLENIPNHLGFFLFPFLLFCFVLLWLVLFCRPSLPWGNTTSPLWTVQWPEAITLVVASLQSGSGAGSSLTTAGVQNKSRDTTESTLGENDCWKTIIAKHLGHLSFLNSLANWLNFHCLPVPVNFLLV